MWPCCQFTCTAPPPKLRASSVETAAIAELLQASGVGETLAARLAEFGAAVLAANRRFNLTGAKDAAAFAPHLLDSLTVVPHVSGTYVDVGSGAGLPGIVVALAAGVPATLLEASVKKTTFLNEQLAHFGLAGEALALRAEAAGQDLALRGKFKSATARAVSAITTVAEYLLPLLELGGHAVLQRGIVTAEERQALDDAAPMLGGKVLEEVALSEGRRLIIVEKVADTPARFPRRPGIPEKRPLCI